MTRFRFTNTPLPGLVVVERLVLGDQRGFFSRFFCAESLAQVGFRHAISQINHSYTQQTGSVRGLHFQHPPFAEDKIVSCLHGAIWDVAVDIRRGSPTFLHWHAEVLSADNHKSILIPSGFAHGFQTLTPDCELLYLHSNSYHPEAEAALHIADPALNISWPLPMTELSERDQHHAFIDQHFLGVSDENCP